MSELKPETLLLRSAELYRLKPGRVLMRAPVIKDTVWLGVHPASNNAELLQLATDITDESVVIAREDNEPLQIAAWSQYLGAQRAFANPIPQLELVRTGDDNWQPMGEGLEITSILSAERFLMKVASRGIYKQGGELIDSDL